MAKKSKRQLLETKIKKHIKDLEKRRLDTSEVLNGKDIKQLAWSQKTYDKFMERKKVTLRKERRLKKVTSKNISDELNNQQSKLNKQTLNILQNKGGLKQFENYMNMTSKEQEQFLNEVKNLPSLEEIAKKEVELIGKDFLINRYFKEFKMEDEYLERIEKIIDNFNGDLSMLDDFMEEVTREDFKIYCDTDDYLSHGATDDFRTMMSNRLDKMEQLVRNKYNSNYNKIKRLRK